jgi:hypothetical protein
VIIDEVKKASIDNLTLIAGCVAVFLMDCYLNSRYPMMSDMANWIICALTFTFVILSAILIEFLIIKKSAK